MREQNCRQHYIFAERSLVQSSQLGREDENILASADTSKGDIELAVREEVGAKIQCNAIEREALHAIAGHCVR